MGVGGYMNEGDEWGTIKRSNPVYPFSTFLLINHNHCRFRSDNFAISLPNMADNFNLELHMDVLDTFTYEQLEQEKESLMLQANQLTELQQQLEHVYNEEAVAMVDIRIELGGLIVHSLERMGHPNYLDQTDPMAYLQDQQAYNQLLDTRDTLDENLEQLRLDHRQDIILIQRELRHVNFLSSLATLTHLIKVERQDLV